MFQSIDDTGISMATPIKKEPEKQAAYVGDGPSTPGSHLNDLDEYLVHAYQAAVLGDLSRMTNVHVLMGDDMQVTATPSKDPSKSFALASPANQPTLRTIGITGDTDAYLRLAADYTLSNKIVPMAIGFEQLQSRYARILQKWALGALPNQAKRIGDIADVLDEFKSAIRMWSVYVPLINLHLGDLTSFKFGDILIRPAKGIANELSQAVEPLIRSSPHSEDEKAAMSTQVKDYIAYFNHIPSIAVCEVESSQDFSTAQALAQITTTLNILRCYIPFIAPPDNRAWIGVAGSLFEGTRVTVAIRDDKEAWNLAVAKTGILMPVEFSAKLLTHMQTNLALQEASELASLEASKRTALQNGLISGAQLLGNAIVSNEDALAVVLSVSAIEAFLFPGNSGASWRRKSALARRLLTGQESHETIEAQLNIVWSLRNHLVQRGPVLFDPQLRNLAQSLASQIFVRLCKTADRYPSIKQLRATEGF